MGCWPLAMISALDPAVLTNVWAEMEEQHTSENCVMEAASAWEACLSLSLFTGSRTTGKQVNHSMKMGLAIRQQWRKGLGGAQKHLKPALYLFGCPSAEKSCSPQLGSSNECDFVSIILFLRLRDSPFLDVIKVKKRTWMQLCIYMCLKHHEEERSLLVHVAEERCFHSSALPADSFTERSLEEIPKACLWNRGEAFLD